MTLTLRRIAHALRTLSAKIPTTRNSALIVALVLAILWWLVALVFRANKLATVWYDQETTFTQLAAHLGDPYQVKGFVNPPWTAVALAPLSFLPVPLAVLIQQCIYFVALTAVIFKFGGNTKIALLALLSYFALDSALELNLDWLVCLGLLVPAMYSGPFLLVKPQDALGYWISLKRRDFVRAVIVTLLLIVLSLLLWQGWPLPMLHAIQINTLGHFYNLAPMALIPWWLSVVLGLILSWRAFKRRDPILAVLAWLFFAPYLTSYALLLPFALFAIRSPRIALLISGVMWIVFGGTILAGIIITLRATHGG